MTFVQGAIILLCVLAIIYIVRCLNGRGEAEKKETCCSGPAQDELLTDDPTLFETSYDDYIASQAIEPQVIESHAEFVKNRLGKNMSWTGRAFSPEMITEFEGTSGVQWAGILGRPQAVPVNNPAQTPDFNPNDFATEPRIRI